MNPKDKHGEFDARLLQSLGLSESSAKMVMEHIMELRADEPNIKMGATAKLWKELGRSKRNPTGDGRIAAFEVPELNLVAVLLVPNGGPDDECDRLRSQIVSEHNLTSELEERRKAMADIVRSLGKGCGGMENHEIAPIVKGVAEKLEKELNQAQEVHDYLVSVNPDNQHLSVLESCIQQRGIQNRLQSQLKETHDCLLARERSLKEEGERWVKAKTERDAAVAALTNWRYSHEEIEAACGGDTANMVRYQVMARRERIDDARDSDSVPLDPAARGKA